LSLLPNNSITAKVRRLHLKSHLFQPALDCTSAYRTSNQVDRPMNYFDRVLYSTQYFHGNLTSARLMQDLRKTKKLNKLEVKRGRLKR